MPTRIDTELARITDAKSDITTFLNNGLRTYWGDEKESFDPKNPISDIPSQISDTYLDRYNTFLETDIAELNGDLINVFGEGMNLSDFTLPEIISEIRRIISGK